MFAFLPRHGGIVLALAGAALACSALSNAPTDDSSPVVVARATLLDQTGARVGTAEFREDRAGAVHIDVSVSSATPGPHGVHIHTTGACSGAAFVDAGGHFNPSATHHGLSNAGGPHAGDLPNIDVLSNGVGRFQGVTSRVTLRPSPSSLLDADGSALVMHAGADDQLTDPSGNSGARIACGTIIREG
jgi:superoxide dismutase, Cu-Zn family